MRVTSEHWETLLYYAETNQEIITNRFVGAQGRENLQQKWSDLAVLLNEVGEGEKTVDQWKKSLADYKSKTKKKFSLIRRSQTATGGGPGSHLSLCDLEMRLLFLMGKSAYEGDDIEEYGLSNENEEKKKRQRTNEDHHDDEENDIETPSKRVRKDSSNHRDRRHELAQHIQEMNDSTLRVLNNIDTNIGSIARDIHNVVIFFTDVSRN